jgi:hypothetical protein
MNVHKYLKSDSQNHYSCLDVPLIKDPRRLIVEAKQDSSVLEFLNNLWGLGTELE